ncbi:hypothetical protein MTR67_037589 [Solanum verrucosum]|uniref:RNase H type-1 domain-containing protein n=1 Tax=Solanum verrucosum TaxID=315347 RepID=A0AAF0UF19_SOLVR|nr:hypothetical protein MTR67_037589 [Solanum verrucosum]
MNSLHNMVIKTDSLTLKNIIQQIWRVPWEIAEIMDEIIREVQQQNVTVQYIFRDGNQMEDYLANIAIISTKKGIQKVCGVTNNRKVHH